MARKQSARQLAMGRAGLFFVCLLACCSGPTDSTTPSLQSQATTGERSAPAPLQLADIPAKPAPAAKQTTPRGASTSFRTWTDNAGEFRIVAEFVSATEQNVTLRNESGKESTVPRDRLSETDQAVVEYAIAHKHDPDAKLIIGHVAEVLDGDTIHIDDLFGDRWTVRLEGIDTPENEQPYGLDARMALRRKLINRICQVEWKTRDRYQRILGHLYVGEHYLNQELVEEGWAWHYAKYSSDKALAEAERAAKFARLGLWKSEQRIAPWDWRNGVRVETAKPVTAPSIRTTDTVVYITRTGSKYHRGGCRYLSKSKIAIPLSRARSAYGACSRCSPP